MDIEIYQLDKRALEKYYKHLWVLKVKGYWNCNRSLCKPTKYFVIESGPDVGKTGAVWEYQPHPLYYIARGHTPYPDYKVIIKKDNCEQEIVYCRKHTLYNWIWKLNDPSLCKIYKEQFQRHEYTS